MKKNTFNMIMEIV